MPYPLEMGRRKAAWSPVLVIGFMIVIVAAGTACGILGPELDGHGTVTYTGFAGGCWAIDTEEDRYEPINLEEEFRIDGLRIDFEAEIVNHLNSPCQMGPLIELQKIRRVGSGG